MKRTLLGLMALLSLCLVAAAASADGKWTAEIPGRGGNTQTTTFTFKTSGSSLEGTIANQRGETPISDGKVEGDNISFSQKMSFNGNDIVMNYKGVVKGDTIEFTREGGRGPATFTAKKAN